MVDAIPPVAVCQDITVELDASGIATITAADVDGGSTDNCGIASLAVSQTSFNCDDIGDQTVVLTVTDVNSNTSTCEATVAVEDNMGLVAQCHDTIVYLDNNGHIIVPADWIDDGSWDNCIDESNFIMTLIPNSFDCSDTGLVDVQLTIYDGMGGSGTCGATVDVRDSTPPAVYCHPITVELDENGEYSLTDANIHAINVADSTRDNCTPDHDLALAILPNSYNCSDEVYHNGPVPVTLYATDLSGNVGTCGTTVTVEDNQIPVALCQDVTVHLDHFGNGTITATGGTGTSGLLPQIDNGSWDNCLLIYTLDKYEYDCSDECSDEGETCNIVTLTVEDEGGNTAECTAEVTVLDTVLPDMYCKNIDVYLDETGNMSIAHDSVDNNSWDACGIATYETSQIDFTCEDECSNSGETCPVVTLTVTDVNGNSDQCTAIVSVYDTVTPVPECHDITIDLADITTGNGLATITPDTVDNGSNDACGILSLVLDITDFDCDDVCTNIAGEDIGTCPTVVLTVTDNNLNTSTCTATVTVRDNDAPHA